MSFVEFEDANDSQFNSSVPGNEDLSRCNEVNLTDIIRDFKSKWPVEEWKKFGLFNEDYLLKINEYWMKFPPPSPSSHYLLGFLYAIIMLVGVIGNFFIIFLLLRKRSLRTPSNIFILNLAVSDGLLLLKMPLFIFNSFNLGPALGNLGCSTYGFLGGLTGTVSIMTLAAIAFDRYQVIVYPLERKTKTTIYVQILLIWIYGGFFSMIPLLDVGLNKYVPEGYLTSCSFDYLTKDFHSRIAVFVFFVAAWIVPISIILCSYLALYKVVFKTRGRQMNNMTRHCREIEIRRPELKAAVTVICVVTLWTLSWTPYAVVALLGITGNEKYLTPLSSMIPALFCKTASCIDPFLYALTNQRFRNELTGKYKKGSRYQTSIKTDKRDFLSVPDETMKRKKSIRKDVLNEVTVLATTI